MSLPWLSSNVGYNQRFHLLIIHFPWFLNIFRSLSLSLFAPTICQIEFSINYYSIVFIVYFFILWIIMIIVINSKFSIPFHFHFFQNPNDHLINWWRWVMIMITLIDFLIIQMIDFSRFFIVIYLEYVDSQFKVKSNWINC